MEQRVLRSVLDVGERVDLLCLNYVDDLFSNKIEAYGLLSLRSYASVLVLRTPCTWPRITTV